MNNYIDQFTGAVFGGRQYVQSIAFLLGMFAQNIIYALALDVIILLEFASAKNQRQNLFSQYDLETVQLAKGKSRGNTVPASELSPNIEEPFDILDLLGLPNIEELLSGPALVEIIFNYLGIQKPVGTRTYFEIKNFKAGLITSFLPSYFIGSLQTTISALKDPMSAGFFNNLGRQIVRTSAEAEPPPASSDTNEFLNWFLMLRGKSSFRFFKTMVDLGDNSIGQFAYEQATTKNTGKVNKRRDALYNSRISFGAGKEGVSMHPSSTMTAPSLFFIPKSFREARRLLSNNGEEDSAQ